MKTQRRILERAKQGDPAAIATWLACCLHRRGLSATTTQEGDCLHVLLESAQAPDQQTAIATVLHELDQLAPAFQVVRVTGKRTGELQPAWDCRFDWPVATAPPARPAHSQRFMYTGMAVIGALIAVNVVLGFRSMFHLWGGAREFANSAVPDIVETWDTEALVDRATPSLLETTPPADLQQDVTQWSQTFGESQQIQPARCNVSPSFRQEGKVTVSRCEAAIEFEHSAATVELDLVQHEAQWQIDRFLVRPADSSVP